MRLTSEPTSPNRRGPVQSRQSPAFGRLWRDEQAVSAVEFALLLPLMLVLYIAGNEVSQSIAIYRKVAQVSYTVGDLITQVSSVQSADITDVLAAGNAVMLPYQASGAQIVVSALNYNGSGYSVAWSKASGSGAALGKGSAPPANYSIPAGIISTPASSCTSSTTPPCPQIVVAQVSYTYTTPFTSIMNSTVFFQKSIWGSNSITLSDIIYMRPRLSVSIPCADC